MKRMALLVAVCLTPYLWAVDRETENAAIKLVDIHGKIWGGLEAKREFEFMLPRFRSICSEFYTSTEAANKLVEVWRKMSTGGGRDSILDFSKTVYDISHAVHIAKGERSLRCADLWIAYGVLRMQGRSVASAKEQVMRGGILSGGR